ncbi:MAG TPA: SigE family RNA polymerase sigma factor [Propionicimonas sp.]|nr:SigE family RNA polymerase sigma factor [Propionicimonas sp.]
MTEYATAVALPTTSFEEFVANRGRALAGFALLVTGNRADAQDAVQEALIGAYPRWQRIAAQGDPSAYVRRSIINRHISLRRKLSRLVALGDTEQPAPDRTTELIGRDWALKLVGQLPAKQRVAVVLRVLEDQGFPEIAALMGVSEANARKLVSRGLAALRSELERGRQ